MACFDFSASLVTVIQRMYVFTFNICQVVCRCRTFQAVVLTPLKEGFQMVQSCRRSVGIPVLSRALPPAVHLSSQRAYRQAIGGR